MTRPGHHEVVDATVAVEDAMQPQRVPVRMYEAPEALVIIAPMPAVQPSDVHVELRDEEGRLVADATGPSTELRVPDARLW